MTRKKQSPPESANAQQVGQAGHCQRPGAAFLVRHRCLLPTPRTEQSRAFRRSRRLAREIARSHSVFLPRLQAGAEGSPQRRDTRSPEATLRLCLHVFLSGRKKSLSGRAAYTAQEREAGFTQSRTSKCEP
jgi:hypothetical protein